MLDGRIALHTRLPAERELAAAVGASRPTVTAAYDLLRQEGYARSRQGAGTWTALPRGRAPRSVDRFLEPSDSAIDLARAAPGLPGGVLERALEQAAPRLAGHAATPGYHPFGLPELRALVAERFTARGLATVPEQVLVTSGAQHALSLVTGLMCGPGDRVLVENPTYPNALEAFRRAGLRTAPVPVADGGWDAGVVEAVLRRTVPRLGYLVPDFHNPTGCLMPQADRERVAGAARRAGTWLVADETLADLALDVPAPAPFACSAPGGAGQVVTIGSMSKSYWGGLRVGWVRAPARLVTELAAQRIATDLSGPVLDQLVAARLLDRAGELLPPRLDALREQRDALAGALAEHLPGWRWRTPPGGLSFWVDLGEPVASGLAERALGYGVRIEGGGFFGADPGLFEQRLRIPFTLPPGTLREAVRRLAAALAAGPARTSVAARTRWVA
ncbi:MocR-like transcription factor YczR [Actinacidiphila yeochonensis]|uniref:MocR-like transcription factor YczR n=1 Tax=Actinacidiphila yeochonensis TaxID=89050 RepID=UPI000A74489C|nr:PLP-dependent aminotransferase family protein [Actinacidiphila yeochonensis]